MKHINRIDAFAYVLLLVLSCAAVNREVAKDQYALDLQGCIDHNDTKASIDSCLSGVRAKWDEAGAPSATIDGGIQ